MRSDPSHPVLSSAEVDTRADVADRLPAQAWIAPTGRCNRFCAHCPIRVMGRVPDTAPDLDLAIVERLRSELFPALSTLKLGGNNNGEPLLAREWEAVFASLDGLALRPWVITNGFLLTTARAEALVRRGAIVDVSLDAATEETYRSIRGKGLETVVAHIETACKLKRERPESGAEARVTTTLWRRNLDELPRLVELAARLGVDRVQVSHLIPMREEQRFESLFYHRAESNRVLADARALAEQLGLMIEVPPPMEDGMDRELPGKLPGEALGATAPRRCLHPWVSTSVTETGWVTPCCASDQRLGDLKKQSFADIWNGPAYRKLRVTVNSDHPPLYCRRCTLRGARMTNTDWAGEEDFLSVIGPSRKLDGEQFLRLVLQERQASSRVWRLAYRGYLWWIGIRH